MECSKILPVEKVIEIPATVLSIIGVCQALSPSLSIYHLLIQPLHQPDKTVHHVCFIKTTRSDALLKASVFGGTC